MTSFAVSLIGLLVLVSVAPAQPSLASGQVRLADGQPVAGAQVLLFDLEHLRRGPVARATTDPNGQFALALSHTALPPGFSLGQNYPNPFNPGTVIPYQLARAGYVRLDIFNLLGQRVATLVAGEQAAGSYTARWDGRDGSGRGVAAGVYLYRLLAGGGTTTRRLVLVDGPAGMGSGVGRGGGPVAAVAAPGAYGLTVSGVGLETYVDAAFRVGSGPVAVVVSAVGPGGRGKAATGGYFGGCEQRWSGGC